MRRSEVKHEERRSRPNVYVIDTIKTPYEGTTIRMLDRRHIGRGFAIRLPSGMCHEYATLERAYQSQYWPASGPGDGPPEVEL